MGIPPPTVREEGTDVQGSSSSGSAAVPATAVEVAQRYQRRQ